MRLLYADSLLSSMRIASSRLAILADSLLKPLENALPPFIHGVVFG